MDQVFGLITVVLLSIVAGLLIWLHFKLRKFQKLSAEVNHLSQEFTNHLLAARQAMKELSLEAQVVTPELEGKLQEFYKIRQEMEYMLRHAEKKLKKFDDLLASSSAISLPVMENKTKTLPTKKVVRSTAEQKLRQQLGRP